VYVGLSVALLRSHDILVCDGRKRQNSTKDIIAGPNMAPPIGNLIYGSPLIVVGIDDVLRALVRLPVGFICSFRDCRFTIINLFNLIMEYIMIFAFGAEFRRIPRLVWGLGSISRRELGALWRE